jgi:hypothetical protein
MSPPLAVPARLWSPASSCRWTRLSWSRVTTADLHEVDLFITVELLDGRDRLVGLGVVSEGDDDDLVRADGVGVEGWRCLRG